MGVWVWVGAHACVCVCVIALWIKVLYDPVKEIRPKQSQ